MLANQTCGPLFQKCLEQAVQFETDPTCLFACGHVTGQAEKIYLGACSAAMFRPSLEFRDSVLKACILCSSVYSLEVSVFEREEITDEIWLHTANVRDFLGWSMQNVEYNSPNWHWIRGTLCGIPETVIDTEFHLRKGFKETCDKVEQWELNRPSLG